MTDAFDENIIVEAYDDKAIYQVTKLPTKTTLLMNGSPMKVGDKFTQGDVRAGRLSINHDRCEGDKPVEDAFYFRVPLADGTFLDKTTEATRSMCLPYAGTPDNGIFKFPIFVYTQPSPKQLRNSYPTVMEDETRYITKGDLMYSSDTEWIDWYLNRTDVPVYPTSQSLGYWDRFAGRDSFTYSGYQNVAVPPGNDAALWQWTRSTRNGPGSNSAIILPKNTENYTGVVSRDQIEYYTSSAIVSSDVADDDLIGMVIAYKTVNGVPYTLSAVRSGGMGSKEKATLRLDLWGTYDADSGAPEFMVTVGKFTAKGVVSDLTAPGQTGSQIFEYVVDASNFASSNPVEIIFSNQFGQKDTKTLIVNSIKVDGTEATSYTLSEGNNNTTPQTPITITQQSGRVRGRGGWAAGNASSNVKTWYIMSTIGNTRTIISDNSAAAPNLLGNSSNQNWADMGATRIQVVRKGDQIEVTTSQFGDPDLELDESTKITISVPAEFAGPQQFGFSALSQQNALFESMTFKALPNPPPAEVPDPKDQDPYWERFPVLYTVSSVAHGSIAEFYLNDQKLKAGDQFTHKDLVDRKLKVVGLFKGGGRDISFRFRVCAGTAVCKCTNGEYKVYIKEWPWPEMKNNQVTIDECSNADDNVIDPTGVTFFVSEIGASRPDQLTISYDASKSNPENKVELVPSVFTQKDINDGKVKLRHNCGAEVKRQELVWVNVCTQHNKCKSFPIYVNVIPLPIEVPPLDPGITITPALCTFARNFTGDGMRQIGECGTWTKLIGRQLPPPTTPGEIVYIPDAVEGPKTVVTIPTPDGNEWQELPFNVISGETSQCPPMELAPNTDRSKSYIEMEVWGDYGLRAPFFDLYAGNNLVDSGIKVDRLKAPGQPGTQKYGYTVETAKLGNGPVKILYTGNEIGNDPDINMYVYSITINGKKYTPGNGLLFKTKINGSRGNKLMSQLDQVTTPPGPYEPAPYVGKGFNCFYGKDGTQWVSDKDGVWRPVEPKPGMPLPDWTPLIKTDEFLVQTDTLDLPELKLPVYHKPTKTVFTEVKNETPILSDNPYTKIAAIDQFLWIGPNEFWIKNGSRFSMYFMANRFNVRFDILPNLGTQLISPTDPLIWDRANVGKRSILRANPNTSADKINPTLWAGTRSIRDAMGTPFGPSDGNRIRQVTPIKTAFDVDNTYNPVQQPAHSLGSYVTRIPGTQSLGAFASSIRPKLIPEFGTMQVNVEDPNPKKVTRWKESPEYIYSYSGFNEPGFKQFAAGPYNPTGDFIAAAGGTAYGTTEMKRHFDEYKLNGNYNYKPPRQTLGWVTAQYMFLNWYSINGPHEKLNGGAYDGTPPSNFDYYFEVRAYDAITGEEKVRKYAVHWNATGLNPKTKKASAITDTVDYWKGDPSIDPPPSGTAVCQFDDVGAIGQCTFTGNFKPGSY